MQMPAQPAEIINIIQFQNHNVQKIYEEKWSVGCRHLTFRMYKMSQGTILE